VIIPFKRVQWFWEQRHDMTKIDGFKYFRRQQGCKFVVSFHFLIKMLSKQDIPQTVHGTWFLFISSVRRERMAGVLITSEKGGDIGLCSSCNVHWYTYYDLMDHDIIYSGRWVP
jgi:hypothetical protein